MNDNKGGGITLQKKHIVIAVIIIILLLIGGVALGANWKRSSGDGQSDTKAVNSTADSAKPSLDIDPNAGNWEGQTPEDKGGEAVGIKIPGYPSITIQKDVTDVKMALLNPEGNPCYFKFEIVLKDTGETIYESKYVPPGQSITDVTLNRALSEGEYDATIKITTIALDQETPLNGANVETVLYVK